MKFDPRILRVWAAGAVFGAGASYLVSGGNERAQYVFFALLIGWIVLVLISRVAAEKPGAPRRRR
jgi:ABC-type Fe3+-siderophore transport system permease subunit